MIYENPANIIRQSFVISFILLIGIISTYQGIIFIQSWTGDSDANKVNIAGRQRMLSQRIGKNLLLSVSKTPSIDQEFFVQQAIDDIYTLEANHLKLKQASLNTLLIRNSLIQEALTKISKPLMAMKDALKKLENKKIKTTYLSNQDIELSLQNYFIYEKSFLIQMNEIVKLYEKELERYITQLNALSWIGAIIILLVMFINGKLVIQKAIKAVELQFTALKNNKEFQETILNCSREGIISINEYGIISSINTQAKNLFLGSDNDYLGKRITHLLPTFNIESMLVMNNSSKIELEGVKNNGKSVPLVINLSRVDLEERHEVIIFIQDLTDIKKREQELRSIKKEVEDAVDANNTKSQFLSNMSHELRTPLNSIIGFSQLLETDTQPVLNKEHLEYVGYIHNAGEHLLSLINEILDFAKLESGQISLSLEEVNLSQIIKEVLILVYNLAIKRKIKILTQLESLPDYYIIADKVRIKQVLLNLVSNAIKYNRDNGKIEIEVESSGTKFLKINVIDNGYGIAENKLTNLFEPFNRLGAENSHIEGTGIGLTITKNLVEEMQGKIGVISEEGKGSNFWVELPLATNKKTISNQFIHSPVSQLIQDTIQMYATIQDCEIMYIEDNYSNTALIKSFVNRIQGMTLYDAENAHIGLKMIAKIKPDLILMDIDLPEINGFEALKIIRESEQKNTPIIAVSANVMKEDINKGLNAGFDAYITKPIAIDNFYETVNTVLENSSNISKKTMQI